MLIPNHHIVLMSQQTEGARHEPFENLLISFKTHFVISFLKIILIIRKYYIMRSPIISGCRLTVYFGCLACLCVSKPSLGGPFVNISSSPYCTIGSGEGGGKHIHPSSLSIKCYHQAETRGQSSQIRSLLYYVCCFDDIV